MDATKRLEGLNRELSNHEHSLDALEEEFRKGIREQKKLDEEMLKAKMLQGEDREERKQEAEENWNKVNELKTRIEEKRVKIKCLTFARSKAEKEALDSIRSEQIKIYAQAVRDFIKELKRLQEMELELRKMRYESNKKSSSLVSSKAHGISGHSLLPSLKSVLISPESEYANRNPVSSFVDDCLSKGLDVLD